MTSIAKTQHPTVSTSRTDASESSGAGAPAERSAEPTHPSKSQSCVSLPVEEDVFEVNPAEKYGVWGRRRPGDIPYGAAFAGIKDESYRSAQKRADRLDKQATPLGESSPGVITEAEQERMLANLSEPWHQGEAKEVRRKLEDLREMVKDAPAVRAFEARTRGGADGGE